jgi:hypothetical protein
MYRRAEASPVSLSNRSVMRDDLLEAWAGRDWAIAQIKLLMEELGRWQESRPYYALKKRDPQTREQLVVARLRLPMPLTFNAWVGAIINELRSSLDLLAAALARRNGKKPTNDRHFPIFDSELDMIDPLSGIDSAKRKKWLSAADRAAIKSLKPYKGVDDTIWPLHHLDIVRKHERLISAGISPIGILITGHRRTSVWGTKAIRVVDDETVLARFAPDDDIPVSHDNALIALDIRFNEAAFGYADEQVFPVLNQFAGRIREIIELFDD